MSCSCIHCLVPSSRSAISKIGGVGDNDDFRSQLNKDRDQAKALCHQILEGINQNPAREHDQMRTQINNDFAKELAKYERISRDLSRRDQELLQKLKTGSSAGARGGYTDYGSNDPEAYGTGAAGYGQADDAPMMVSQQDMQRVDLQQMRERQAALLSVQRDVEEIHSMFTDLQTIVEKDGEVLDDIVDRVGATRDRAAEALPALQEAEDYQRRARRQKCILMLIVVIVLSVIVIGVWQGLT